MPSLPAGKQAGVFSAAGWPALRKRASQRQSDQQVPAGRWAGLVGLRGGVVSFHCQGESGPQSTQQRNRQIQGQQTKRKGKSRGPSPFTARISGFDRGINRGVRA